MYLLGFHHRIVAFGCMYWLFACGAVLATDWSSFRNGPERTGATNEIVQLNEHPSWVYRAAAPPRMAWSSGEGRVMENHLIGNLTKYDDAIHPVVAGDRVYFGSSVDHHLHCLNLTDGSEVWSFATGGPIRLAPTVDQQHVFFGSDDGFAYCLSTTDGRVVWKQKAGPADEWLLARGEMISRWPVRTGVLVDRGVAFFGSGIFPHEDVFLYAVDANTGKLLWRQDNLSVLDAGRNDLSPQGYLLASDDLLFVPSGRSLPAAIDRRTGELLYKRTHSWRTTAGGVIGGVHALLSDGQIYTSGPHHWLAMDQLSGDVGFGWFAGSQIAVRDGDAFAATGQTVSRLNRMEYAVNSRRRHELEMLIYDNSRLITSQPENAVELRKVINDAQTELKAIAMIGIVWQQPSEDDSCIVASGDQVFLGGDSRVTSYSIDGGAPLWKAEVTGEASGLVIANKHLLVSTSDGSIYSYASMDAPAQQVATQRILTENPYPQDSLSEAYSTAAEEILTQHGSRRGFCLVVGNEVGRLALELAKRSEMQIYAVAGDAANVDTARKRLNETGLYGRRIVVHQADPSAIPYANYFANLIVSDSYLVRGIVPAAPEKWSRHLKPLGGTIILGQTVDSNAETRVDAAKVLLEGANVEGPVTISTSGNWATLTRGALPGAGNWSHQYGNPANTGVVDETRVKSGLGVLWYGDPGPGDMVNRHDGAVGPLATNGRLFVQGETTIQAYDAYNGLFLWKHENPEALRTGVFQNQNPANLAANDERLFHFVKDQCIELDAATGLVLRKHRLPEKYDNEKYEWGYVATHDDLLFGAATLRKELEAKQRRRGKVTEDATDSLFAIDLKTGKHLWTYQGLSISHHTLAISDDSIYFVDSSITSEQRAEMLLADKSQLQSLTGPEQALAEQRALAADVRRAISIDSRSGNVNWSVPVDVTDCSDIGAGGGKLTLLYQNNVLLLGGANANGHYWKQFVAGEFTRRRMVALSASDGHKLWAKDANYKGRPITISNRILAEPWSFDLYTGEQQMRKHPLTGQEVPWSLMRTGHHCGVLTGCDSGMLLFRSGDTAFYDLTADVGAQHFAGHRLGCWINAIPANGLVMIPEASAGCVCQFSIASTIVMEPRTPRRDWTIHSAVGLKTPVESMNINFGAPGDRKDTKGNLWLSYPRRKAYQETSLDVALDLKVEFANEGRYTGVSDASMHIANTDVPWLYSSWAEGLRQFSLPLRGPTEGPADYQLRMHFGLQPSEDSDPVMFDVKIQGMLALEDVTLAPPTANEVSALVVDVPSIAVENNLLIELIPKRGTPRLNAVEVRVIK
jgi:outer membrane protein assembly factor BamB